MNEGDWDESLRDDSVEGLQDLRQQVHINNGELIDIVLNTDHFIFKIRQLNQVGINYLNNQEVKEALIYLQEAQKLLQYGASCGKTIDRLLIIFTLQNQASAYQKQWELEKASNYMQAIIFNMNTYLKSPPTIVIDSQIQEPTSTPYINLSTLVTKRLRTSHYYLQYSALNSQIQRHQVALNSALDALTMLKHLCQQCYSYERYLKQEDTDSQRNILRELSTIKEEVELEKYDKYLLLAKKSVKKLKYKILKPDKLQEKQLQRFIEFGIADVMQINHVHMNELDEDPKVQDQINYVQKLYKALYISIAFFAIATQLRLISLHKYQQYERKGSKQFRKSQLYHLEAIIVASKYSPCEGKYLSHILKSYKSHYQIDLSMLPQQSQQTTNETDFDSQAFLLTPAKNNKTIFDFDGISTRTKFLMKMQSLSKIEERETQKLYPKIPLLHMKKKKKKNKSNSKSKSKPYQKGKILKATSINKKDKKRENVHRQNIKDERVSVDKKKKDKFSGRHKDINQSHSHSKNKKELSQQHPIKKSKEKVKKKTHRLNEEYFRKPQQKKPKTKLNISNSLTKIKMDLPSPVYSPKISLKGKKIVESQSKNYR